MKNIDDKIKIKMNIEELYSIIAAPVPKGENLKLPKSTEPPRKKGKKSKSSFLTRINFFGGDRIRRDSNVTACTFLSVK